MSLSFFFFFMPLFRLTYQTLRKPGRYKESWDANTQSIENDARVGIAVKFNYYKGIEGMTEERGGEKITLVCHQEEEYPLEEVHDHRIHRAHRM